MTIRAAGLLYLYRHDSVQIAEIEPADLQFNTPHFTSNAGATQNLNQSKPKNVVTVPGRRDAIARDTGLR
jgi:hypothetical protein